MSIIEQSAKVGGQVDHELDKGRRPLLPILWSLVKLYWTSAKKKQAWWLLITVIVMVILVAGIDAYKTYLTKWVMNALEKKDAAQIYATLKIAVISLILSTPLGVYRDYAVRYLQYAWRKWFNVELLNDFFRNRTYFSLYLYSDIDNPDQRLAQDLDEFVISSTDLFRQLTFSFITFITFSSVLWTISPLLVFCALGYALLGSVLVLIFTGKLVKVNFRNIKFQANYRYNLIHVRSNSEAIAFYQGEERERSLLLEHFNRLINNFKRLIGIERDISFITYSYLLLSVLFAYYILTPRYLAGKIGIGTISQAAVVFGVVLNSLSLIVSKFKDLSTYAAVIRRLGGFIDALNFEPDIPSEINRQISNRFELQAVTVKTPDSKKTLVENLSLTIEPGKGLLIMGPSGCGKSSLLRALAGLWTAGKGTMITPPVEKTVFLPQQPYLILGNLREQLLYPNLDQVISDEQLQHALEMVNLDTLSERCGGFDKVLDWAEILSVGEQQRVAFVRLLLANPEYAILDEATSALDEPNEEKAYQHIIDSGATYISVGHRSSLLDFHDYVLILDQHHGWQLLSIDDYKEIRKK